MIVKILRIEKIDDRDEEMDLKNLITFIHVAELGSFTKAGEKLGFSQSTVSFQIRSLEEELHVRLFDRINRTVVLTEKGHAVLNYAHQVGRLTQEMEKGIWEEDRVTGHVRLAMADSLCTSLLQDDFEKFRREYPGITLKIVAAGTEEMFRLLNHNETDAILTLDNHIYGTEYVIAKEEKAEVHFVAGAGHPLCREGRIPLSELVCQPFILTERWMSYRRLLDEKLAQRSLEIQPVLEIGSTELICSLIEQGIGLSFLPDYVTEKAVREGRMVRLDTEDLDIEIWKQLLYHRDKWISPQLESVLQYCMKKEFSAES